MNEPSPCSNGDAGGIMVFRYNRQESFGPATAGQAWRWPAAFGRWKFTGSDREPERGFDGRADG